jgi:dTDP-glucose pyrophosphorylase
MQIIPIAGKGNRFKSDGYSLAKYLLPVSGKSVIEHILSYFDKELPTLLILNQEDENKEVIEKICISLEFEDFQVVEIQDTNGQLASVVQGVKVSKYNAYNGPVWVYNGDTIRKKELPYSLFDNIGSEGFIEVFNEVGDHWSFVDSLGKVSQITEKEKISDFCCTGLYGFRDLGRIIDYVDTGSVGVLQNELYVSGVFKNLIHEGLGVWSFQSKRSEFLLCGTPDEYENVQRLLDIEEQKI